MLIHVCLIHVIGVWFVYFIYCVVSKIEDDFHEFISSTFAFSVYDGSLFITLVDLKKYYFLGRKMYCSYASNASWVVTMVTT